MGENGQHRMSQQELWLQLLAKARDGWLGGCPSLWEPSGSLLGQEKVLVTEK